MRVGKRERKIVHIGSRILQVMKVDGEYTRGRGQSPVEWRRIENKKQDWNG